MSSYDFLRLSCVILYEYVLYWRLKIQIHEVNLLFYILTFVKNCHSSLVCNIILLVWYSVLYRKIFLLNLWDWECSSFPSLSISTVFLRLPQICPSVFEKILIAHLFYSCIKMLFLKLRSMFRQRSYKSPCFLLCIFYKSEGVMINISGRNNKKKFIYRLNECNQTQKKHCKIKFLQTTLQQY